MSSPEAKAMRFATLARLRAWGYGPADPLSVHATTTPTRNPSGLQHAGALFL